MASQIGSSSSGSGASSSKVPKTPIPPAQKELVLGGDAFRKFWDDYEKRAWFDTSQKASSTLIIDEVLKPSRISFTKQFVDNSRWNNELQANADMLKEVLDKFPNIAETKKYFDNFMSLLELNLLETYMINDKNSCLVLDGFKNFASIDIVKNNSKIRKDFIEFLCVLNDCRSEKEVAPTLRYDQYIVSYFSGYSGRPFLRDTSMLVYGEAVLSVAIVQYLFKGSNIDDELCRTIKSVSAFLLTLLEDSANDGLLIKNYKKKIKSYFKILGCGDYSAWKAYLENEKLLIRATQATIKNDTKELYDELWGKMTLLLSKAEQKWVPLLHCLTDLAIVMGDDDKIDFIDKKIDELTIESNELNVPFELDGSFELDKFYVSAKEIMISFIGGIKIRLSFAGLDRVVYAIASHRIGDQFDQYSYDRYQIDLGQRKEILKESIDAVEDFEKKIWHVEEGLINTRMQKLRFNCPIGVLADLKEYLTHLTDFASSVDAVSVGEKLIFARCLLIVMDQIQLFLFASATSSSTQSFQELGDKISEFNSVLQDIFKEYGKNREALFIRLQIDIHQAMSSSNSGSTGGASVLDIIAEEQYRPSQISLFEKTLNIFKSLIRFIQVRIDMHQARHSTDLESISGVSSPSARNVQVSSLLPPQTNLFKEHLITLKSLICFDDIKNLKQLKMAFLYLKCYVETSENIGQQSGLFWGNSLINKILDWYISHVDFFSGIRMYHVSDVDGLATARCPYKYFQAQIHKYLGYQGSEKSARSLDVQYMDYIRDLKIVKQMFESTQTGKWTNVIRLYDIYLKNSKEFGNHFQILLNVSHAYWNIENKCCQKSIEFTKKAKVAVKSEGSIYHTIINRVIEERDLAFSKLSPWEQAMDGMPTKTETAFWTFSVVSMVYGIYAVYRVHQARTAKPGTEQHRLESIMHLLFASTGCLACILAVRYNWLARPFPRKIY